MTAVLTDDRNTPDRLFRPRKAITGNLRPNLLSPDCCAHTPTFARKIPHSEGHDQKIPFANAAKKYPRIARLWRACSLRTSPTSEVTLNRRGEKRTSASDPASEHTSRQRHRVLRRSWQSRERLHARSHCAKSPSFLRCMRSQKKSDCEHARYRVAEVAAIFAWVRRS